MAIPLKSHEEVDALLDQSVAWSDVLGLRRAAHSEGTAEPLPRCRCAFYNDPIDPPTTTPC
eukprot:scaffold345661_cov38-Prasinocladus_malaysianus.AAC.1